MRLRCVPVRSLCVLLACFRVALCQAGGFPTTTFKSVVGFNLTVNASVLNATGSWVSVAWAFPASSTTGAAAPSPFDLLAYYVPATANISATAPVKFRNATGEQMGSVRHVQRFALFRTKPDASRSCACSFRLLNQRSPGVFYYLRAGSGRPSALARSPPVAFARPSEPTSVHVALTLTPGEARVTWSSGGNASSVAVQTVRWGLAPGVAPPGHGVAVAASTRYGRAEMCGAAPGGGASVAAGAGWLDPGEVHTALLSPLPPAARVFYAVGADATGWSPVFAFSSPPRVGAPCGVAVVGALGTDERDGATPAASTPGGAPFGQPAAGAARIVAPAALATCDALAAEVAPPPNASSPTQPGAPSGNGRSLVLSLGDLSLASGFGAMWDAYGDATQATAAAAPWMAAPGSHESDYFSNPLSGGAFSSAASVDSGGECGVAYSARFPMPPPASAATPWYSFDHGAIHFTVVSTEFPFAQGTPQHAWAVADLAAAAAARDAASLDPADGAAASEPRWLVFAGSRPFLLAPGGFGSAADATNAKALASAFSAAWAASGVDLTLSAHARSYGRSKPVAYGEVQAACDAVTIPTSASATGYTGAAQRGTVHVVAGHGGAPFVGPPLSVSGSQLEGTLFEAASTSHHGYVVIDADATSMRVSSVATDVADGAAGRQLLIDSFALSKPPGPRACFPLRATGGDVVTPGAEEGTLVTACVLTGLVALGYGIRSAMSHYDRAVAAAAARAATAALLQQREANAREFEAERVEAEALKARWVALHGEEGREREERGGLPPSPRSAHAGHSAAVVIALRRSLSSQRRSGGGGGGVGSGCHEGSERSGAFGMQPPSAAASPLSPGGSRLASAGPSPVRITGGGGAQRRTSADAEDPTFEDLL